MQPVCKEPKKWGGKGGYSKAYFQFEAIDTIPEEIVERIEKVTEEMKDGKFTVKYESKPIQ
ncbi:MAG: hypothetical protein DRP87_13930 [Spirochaetes bacterium]|nr:MAG: hypothetical protein DRP87_13930 [Spirochaetota bacterium]